MDGGNRLNHLQYTHHYLCLVDVSNNCEIGSTYGDVPGECDADGLVLLGDHGCTYDFRGCVLSRGYGTIVEQVSQVEEHGIGAERDGVVPSSPVWTNATKFIPVIRPTVSRIIATIRHPTGLHRGTYVCMHVCTTH